jgi:hypothetical protein
MVSVNVPPPCNKVDPDALNIAVVTFGAETRAGRRALRVIQQLGMKDCSLIDFRLVLQPTEEEEKACRRKGGKRSAVKRAVIGHRQFLSSMHKALSDTTKHKDKPARVFFRVCRDGGTKSYVVGATEVAALEQHVHDPPRWRAGAASHKRQALPIASHIAIGRAVGARGGVGIRMQGGSVDHREAIANRRGISVCVHCMLRAA